jgi:ribonuclease R
MRRADPQFEREKAKYEHPLPSREYILETLAAQGAPLEFERLAKLLDIQSFELEPFQRRLGAMAREAQLMQNRRGDWLIPDKADLVRGRVTGHPDGYGFLTPEGGGTTCSFPPRKWTRCCMATRSSPGSSASIAKVGPRARSLKSRSGPTASWWGG